jgi:hypothetical protein
VPQFWFGCFLEIFKKIKLRVVGIQFSKEVTLEIKKPTIEDVMLAAGGGPTDFKFVKAPDGTLQTASAHIALGKSISSGRKIEPGLYSLTDGAVSGNSISTWQWYLIRDGKQINLPNHKIEKFSDPLPKELALQDGDMVVWRLVVVLGGPTTPKTGSAFEAKVAMLGK